MSLQLLHKPLGHFPKSIRTTDVVAGKVVVPYTADFDLQGDYSFICWARFTRTWVNALAKCTAGWVWGAVYLGCGVAGLSRFGINAVGTLAGTITVNDGRWHFLAATYNLASTTARLYADCILDDIDPAFGSPGNAAHDITVGARGTTYKACEVYKAMIYTRTVQPGELYRMMTMGEVPRNGLVMLLDFKGHRAMDKSGRGNHGTYSATGVTRDIFDQGRREKA